MGMIGKGSDILTANISKEKKRYIKARAKVAGNSVSEFTVAIVDYWLSQGAPVLLPRDVLLPIPKFRELSRYERFNPEPS